MLIVLLFAVVGVTGASYDFSDACRGCVYKTSNIGYITDPYDCNKYFICYRNTRQVTRRACPPGLYWNNDILTCDWPYNVDCKGGLTQTTTTAVDLCSIRKHTSNRWSYKELYGISWVTRRCEVWQMYDSAVCECVNNPCYGKRKFPYRPHSYWQLDNGVWKVRPCALGTAYNETSCNCDIHSSSRYYPVCRPVLALPLHRYYGIRDNSGNNHHIDNHGVITQNTAYWNGNSYLSVPYFTNGFYGNKLTISFYFKRLDRQIRVLLSNSICDDVQPSILIYLNAWGICFKFRNDAGVTVSTCVRCEAVKVWQLVFIRVEDGQLYVRVPTGWRKRPFSGNIASTLCPLTIGKGTDYKPFKGSISWLTVYQCKPYIFRVAATYLRASLRNPENMEDMAGLVTAITTSTTTTTSTTSTTTTTPTTNTTTTTSTTTTTPTTTNGTLA